MTGKPSPPKPKRVQAPAHREPSAGNRRRWLVGGAAILVVAAVAGAFVIAGKKDKPQHAAPITAPRSGPAPAFNERNVLTDQPVTLESLRGRNVLLFFSEGVMCQACFEQIRDLEKHVFHLERMRLSLVNITTDPPNVLREAVTGYGIKTPMVSDEDRDMSHAYDVLGQGMHPDTAGHTFVLIDGKGIIRWRRDFTTMYVPPEKLLAALPTLGRAA